MVQIKDDLGREFISLPSLSSILNLSTKQIRRHIRDKRMLSIKRGQQRYISKEDILREYPSLSKETLNRDIGDILADKRDTIGTSVAKNDVPEVLNVPDVQFKKDIDLYQQDQKTEMMLTKIEQVKVVITRLEKSIADIGYIQQDTKTIERKLDRVNAKMFLLEGHKGQKGHKIYLGVLFVVVLAITGTSIYGIIQFKGLYRATQENFNSQLFAKNKEIVAVSAKHMKTVKQYEQKTGEQNLELEKMKVKLDQKEQQIQFLQETITKQNKETIENERGQTDGYKNSAEHLQDDERGHSKPSRSFL